MFNAFVFDEMHRPDKYIQTAEQGMVIMGVTEQEAGRYDCRLGADTLCSYNITVDTQRCAAPSKSHDYQKVYSDWCHEFEKYKMAMKTWERRQLVNKYLIFQFILICLHIIVVYLNMYMYVVFLFIEWLTGGTLNYFFFCLFVSPPYSNATVGRLMTAPAAIRTLTPTRSTHGVL